MQINTQNWGTSVIIFDYSAGLQPVPTFFNLTEFSFKSNKYIANQSFSNSGLIVNKVVFFGTSTFSYNQMQKQKRSS